MGNHKEFSDAKRHYLPGEAEEHADHLRRLLLTFRSIKQLIANETDSIKLIQKTCESLTDTMGYMNAWVAIFDHDGERVEATAESEFSSNFESFSKSLKEGDYPQCLKYALESASVITIEDPASNCTNCCLAPHYEGRSGLIRKLHYRGITLGVLTVTVPASFAYDDEELIIFDELASDLSYALHQIRVNAQHQETHRRYSEMFEGSRDGFVMVNPEGQVLEANQAFCELTGYTLSELRELKGILEITPERWHQWEKDEIWTRHLNGALCSGLYEKEYIRKDGKIIPVELLSHAFFSENGKINYLWGIVRNIEERKADEETLRESEERNRLLSDLTMEGIIIHKNGIAVDLNASLAAMLGYEKEELINFNFMNFIHPDDLELVRRKIKEECVAPYSIRLKKPGGEFFIAEVESRNFTRKGELLRVSAVRDVTESRKAEENLRKSEDLLQRIFEILPIGLWFADKEGNLIRGNPMGVKIWGAEPKVSMKEYGAFKAWRLPSREPVKSDEWALAKTIREGVTIVDELLEIEAFDGTRKTILNYTAPVLDQNGKIDGAIILNLDISDRQHLEEQLRHAQKMESIGRLSGGVAHDFNNMLQVILGLTEISMFSMQPHDPNYDNLNEILMAAQRSANITRQLLAFARKQTVTPKILDLNEAVDGLLKMLCRLMGEDIQLNWQPDSSACMVRIDPSQVDQVLANLCVNARDAINGVGQLTIKTRHERLDQSVSSLFPEIVCGNYILLEVIDNGCGIDKKNMERLFEPFFTTKAQGQGTGLGLATVYGIVKQNNGFINAFSEPGKGTTFKIYLPENSDIIEAEKEKQPTAIRGNKEVVLIVEDEISILNLTASMLESMNYQALIASTPEEALLIARERSEEIALLLTDVIMPEMNGVDLAREIKEIIPTIKLIFMSGYTANVINPHGVSGKGMQLIQKPFSIQKIGEKIRQVLDEK